MVIMDTVAVGLAGVDVGLGLVWGAGCGGWNTTGAAWERVGLGPGVKGRAVRFMTPPGMGLVFMLRSELR